MEERLYQGYDWKKREEKSEKGEDKMKRGNEIDESGR